VQTLRPRTSRVNGTRATGRAVSRVAGLTPWYRCWLDLGPMGHPLPRFLLLALLLSAGAGAPADTRAAIEQQKKACAALDQAAKAAGAGQAAEFSRLLKDVARRMDSLAATPSIAPELKKELKTAATDLRARAQAPPARFSPEDSLRLLERVGAALGASPPDLAFQGSYSQTKVQEPAYGGHASAMGPPPEAAPSTGGPSPVQFELVPGLTEKAFCGGRTKDSILESGGSGIALVDYDGDGLLDIYAMSAFELDDKKQRIPHPNAIYGKLEGMKFQLLDVEKHCETSAPVVPQQARGSTPRRRKYRKEQDLG